jgi:hypothetical protein
MKIALFLDIIGHSETFSEHGFQVSGVSPAAGKKNAAGLIEKETLKKRISNNECRISKQCILSILKKTERKDINKSSIFNSGLSGLG